MSSPASFGSYRVLHQIGSGVLGPVFRGYDSQQDRLVAIKTIKLDLVPEIAVQLAEQFRAFVSAVPPHPAIIRTVDAGLSGSTPFVALEYAGGDSLDVVNRQTRVWTLARALPVLNELADAIDASWAQGVGHGSLHPRDVFVASGPADLQITGFGIGQAFDAVGARVPPRRPYSAPERATGAPWDVRADVYSLAVVAHEMLSGHRPVGLADDVEGVAAELAPDRRAGLRKVLATAMAEAPTDRYASAREFVAALAAAGEGKIAAPIAPAAPADPVEEVAPAPAAPPPLVLPRPVPVPTSRSRAIDRERDLERVPASRQMFEATAEPVESPFPWAAMIAVFAAGLVLGSVVFYQVGWSRGSAAAPVVPEGTTVAVHPTPTPDPVVSVPSPTPTPAPPPPAPAPAPTARLVIQSTPTGALVMIDGQRAGETPLTIAVALGRHDIQVARSGYVPRTERIDVTAKPATRTLHVQLRRGGFDSPLAVWEFARFVR